MQKTDKQIKGQSTSIGKKKRLIPFISILESPNVIIDKTTLLEALPYNCERRQALGLRSVQVIGWAPLRKFHSSALLSKLF